jgi:hypothetical protein
VVIIEDSNVFLFRLLSEDAIRYPGLLGFKEQAATREALQKCIEERIDHGIGSLPDGRKCITGGLRETYKYDEGCERIMKPMNLQAFG